MASWFSLSRRPRLWLACGGLLPQRDGARSMWKRVSGWIGRKRDERRLVFVFLPPTDSCRRYRRRSPHRKIFLEKSQRRKPFFANVCPDRQQYLSNTYLWGMGRSLSHTSLPASSKWLVVCVCVFRNRAGGGRGHGSAAGPRRPGAHQVSAGQGLNCCFRGLLCPGSSRGLGSTTC